MAQLMARYYPYDHRIHGVCICMCEYMLVSVYLDPDLINKVRVYVIVY